MKGQKSWMHPIVLPGNNSRIPRRALSFPHPQPALHLSLFWGLRHISCLAAATIPDKRPRFCKSLR